MCQEINRNGNALLLRSRHTVGCALLELCLRFVSRFSVATWNEITALTSNCESTVIIVLGKISINVD